MVPLITEADELERFVQRMGFPRWLQTAWKVERGGSNGQARIVGYIYAPNRDGGDWIWITLYREVSLPLPPYEAWLHARAVLFDLLKHECDEHLCLGDERLYDPHTRELHPTINERT